MYLYSMKYRNRDIGEKPTMKIVQHCISKHKYSISAEQVFDYWEQRKWTCKNGLRVWTVENAVGICNEHIKRKAIKPSPRKKDKTESYAEQLKDERWLAFREFVFKVRGCRCERCGYSKELQVHHIQYKNGRLAWEYTCNEVMVLCSLCHKNLHGIE